ncbi:anaerobic sulfatase maturase [Clostridium sp.]|uniref:anaerobic sulfatase maturase n=1 Tax=Clostridium sp. TaxID=1506 RepID=UPI002FC622E6
MGKNLNLMLKPSSSKCNLKCKYCFYNCIAESREIKDYGFMDESVLEEIIKKAIDYSEDGTCTIGFQGGEPTLIGLDFYKNLIEIVHKYNKNTKFNYVIQTNGLLLDDNFAKFLKENNFLVGLSLDGNKDVHNLNRVDSLNKDTFNSVIKASNILKKYKVDFNILTVVTPNLIKKIDSTYKFYKKNDFKYLQFIPCLEPLEKSLSVSDSYSIKVSNYSKFLNRLFDLWYDDMINSEFVSIRLFDNILSSFLGYDYESCDMKGYCSCQNIIESDGSVYPCDFYTYEKYSVGNILEESFADIHNKDKTLTFIKDSFNISSKCLNCKFKHLCRGGCRRHRNINNDNLNFLCDAYYDFFSKSLSRFEELAFIIRNNNLR